MSSKQIVSDNKHIEFVSSCGKALIIPAPDMKISDIIGKVLHQLIIESQDNPMLKLLISRYSLKLELEQRFNIEFNENNNQKMSTHFTTRNKLGSLIMPPNLLCVDCDGDFKQCKHPLVKIMRELSQVNEK
jgi:hypothetical protein